MTIDPVFRFEIGGTAVIGRSSWLGLAVAGLFAVSAVPAPAQSSSPPNALVPVPGYATDTSIGTFYSPAIRPSISPRQETGTKSPILAGVLSVWVPGFALGSFYAGNPRHGVQHLKVSGGAFALMLLGLAVGHEAGAVPFYLGVGVFAVNWPWSVATAVHDANDRNARVASGSLPGVLDRGSALPRVEVRLVQIRF